MEGNDLSKKELIVKVTLDIIKHEGFKGVTIRKIALLANVNIALVNYYFGSKDHLLNEAIQVLIHSLKESFLILDNDKIQPRERLKRFLMQYVNIFDQYPFIVQKILSSEPFKFESPKKFVHFIKVIGLKKMQATIAELSGEHDPETVTIMTSQILGAVFLPPLIEPMYETVTGTPFADREEQIEILLNRYFPSEKS